MDWPGGQDGAASAQTYDSIEFSREEAEEINRSMDLSMQFWGHVRDTSGIIPANRLKCCLQKPNRSSHTAKMLWDRIKESDIEHIRNVERILMTDGEIKVDQLFDSLGKISEGIGLSFQDVFPEYFNEDIITSATDIMNELLYIYNQSTFEDDEYFSNLYETSFYDETSDLSQDKYSKSELIAVEERLKNLIKKANKFGIENLSVPTSPYLSPSSKLRILEKQVQAKIRLKKINDIIGVTPKVSNLKKDDNSGSIKESDSTYYMKRELSKKKVQSKAEFLQKPAFKSAVKARPLEFNSTIRNAPNLQKRLKSTRKRLVESKIKQKSVNEKLSLKDQNGDMCESENQIKKIRSSENNSNWLLDPSNLNHSGDDKPVKSTIFDDSTDLRSILDIQQKDEKYPITLDSDPDSQKIDPISTNSIESSREEVSRTSTHHKNFKDVSQDEVLPETKKERSKESFELPKPKDEVLSRTLNLLKEAQEQTSQSIVTSFCQTSEPEIKIKVDKLNDISPSSPNSHNTEDEMKVDIQRIVNQDGDTLDIKVMQESLNPLLWPLARDAERTVTTEISLSQFIPGPAVKLSLTNKVKSEDESLNRLAREQPEKVQEAVSYLNDLLVTCTLDTKNNENSTKTNPEENNPNQQLKAGVPHIEDNGKETDYDLNITHNNTISDEDELQDITNNEIADTEVLSSLNSNVEGMACFNLKQNFVKGSCTTAETYTYEGTSNSDMKKEMSNCNLNNFVSYSSKVRMNIAEESSNYNMKYFIEGRSEIEMNKFIREPSSFIFNNKKNCSPATSEKSDGNQKGFSSDDSVVSEGGEMNVNMMYLSATRDEIRSSRLFQVMVGKDPPRFLEEIGDGNLVVSGEGSPQWLDDSKNEIATDSMDSLFVNIDRPHDPSIGEIHTEFDRISNSLTNSDSEAIPMPEEWNYQSPPEISLSSELNKLSDSRIRLSSHHLALNEVKIFRSPVPINWPVAIITPVSLVRNAGDATPSNEQEERDVVLSLEEADAPAVVEPEGEFVPADDSKEDMSDGNNSKILFLDTPDEQSKPADTMTECHFQSPSLTLEVIKAEPVATRIFGYSLLRRFAWFMASLLIMSKWPLIGFSTLKDMWWSSISGIFRRKPPEVKKTEDGESIPPSDS